MSPFMMILNLSQIQLPLVARHFSLKEQKICLIQYIKITLRSPRHGHRLNKITCHKDCNLYGFDYATRRLSCLSFIRTVRIYLRGCTLLIRDSVALTTDGSGVIGRALAAEFWLRQGGKVINADLQKKQCERPRRN